MKKTLGPQSRLSEALALHADVLEFIVGLNPHDFVRLRNPLMRRLMPPRITLARIAAMTKNPVADVIDGILRAAGEIPDAVEEQLVGSSQVPAALPMSPQQRPNWVGDRPDVTVDLLAADERLDADPMPPIVSALRLAKPGEIVLVKHKWEPQPLYDIWTRQRVEFYADQIGEDEWHIFLRKPS